MNPSDSPVELLLPLSRDNATSVGLDSTSPLRNLINKRENEFTPILSMQVTVADPGEESGSLFLHHETAQPPPSPLSEGLDPPLGYK